MEQWQDAASQQVKLLTNRLNELLTKGLEWMHSELGVDLGLKPELIPPWMILLAASAGLLLMVALWASLCRAVFKKRPVSRSVDEGIEVKRAVSKPVKSEEPKKKKKKAEKKAQPNGRAIAEPQEEAVPAEERVPPHQPTPPEVKKEKIAETKKSKKKAKQAVKEPKPVTAEGKEPEEGTWETKVSNKEKREQRKKDKSSSDGSASPGGGDTPVSTPPEQPKASPAAPPAPANQKKKKGDPGKVKVEAVTSKAKGNEVVEVAPTAADMAVKISAQPVPPKTSSWTTPRQPAPLWRAGIDESWTVIDRPMPSGDLNLVSLAGLGVGTGQPPPVNDLPWLSQHRVDDEWSGLNGGSADPSSDWNAPSEAWGNYEEPTPEPTQEQTPTEPTKASLTGAAEEDDDEKDKGDSTTDGGAKTKRKKKKKKKAAEDGGTAGQVEEPVKEPMPAVSAKKEAAVHENAPAVQPVKAAAVEVRGDRPMKEVISQKPAVTQVPQKSADGEATAKQNNLPAPTQQKKAEESQAPKAAKKKKARRET